MLAKVLNPRLMLAIEVSNMIRKTPMFKKFMEKAAVKAAQSPAGKKVIASKVEKFIDNLTKEDGEKIIKAVQDNKELIMHFVDKM